MLPLILLAIAAPITALCGVLYFREANKTYTTDKERQCESTRS